MELKSKFYLLNEKGEKFMGAGVLWLLNAIERTGSLRKAAQEIDLSYSKAYKMINNLESNLGKAVVDRKKGGQDRAGAELTAFGSQLCQLYNEFQEEAKKRVEEPYQEFRARLNEIIKEC